MAQASVQQYEMTEAAAWGGAQVAYDRRGASIAPTGTYVASTGTIRLPFKLNGTPGLKVYSLDFRNAPGIAVSEGTTTQAAGLISVFAGTGYTFNGSPIQTDTATINTTNPPSGYDGTIDVLLHGHGTGIVTYGDGTTGPTPSTMNVHLAADFGASNASVVSQGDPRSHNDPQPAVFFASSAIDTSKGFLFGPEMLPAIDVSITTV